MKLSTVMWTDVVLLGLELFRVSWYKDNLLSSNIWHFKFSLTYTANRVLVIYMTKMDKETRVADLRFPSTGIASKLQLGTLKAMGGQNYHNAAVAAFSVLNLDVGIDYDSIGSIIELLSPPPHRMQIGECYFHFLPPCTLFTFLGIFQVLLLFFSYFQLHNCTTIL